MIITLCGAECTGKSTLASTLRNHHGADLIEETARIMVNDLKRPLEYSDVPKLIETFIQKRQLAQQRSPFICCDTDFINTWVYSKLYFKQAPPELELLITTYASDCYFLLAPDPTWQNEPHQRPAADTRTHTNHLIEQALQQFNLPYYKILGSNTNRTTAILKHLKKFQFIHDT